MQKQLSEIDIYKYIFSRLVRISFSPEKVSNKELDILEEYNINYPQIFQDAKNEAEDYLRSKVAGEFIPLDDNALEIGGNGGSALSSKAIARLQSILQEVQPFVFVAVFLAIYRNYLGWKCLVFLNFLAHFFSFKIYN